MPRGKHVPPAQRHTPAVLASLSATLQCKEVTTRRPAHALPSIPPRKAIFIIGTSPAGGVSSSSVMLLPHKPVMKSTIPVTSLASRIIEVPVTDFDKVTSVSPVKHAPSPAPADAKQSPATRDNLPPPEAVNQQTAAVPFSQAGPVHKATSQQLDVVQRQTVHELTPTQQSKPDAVSLTSPVRLKDHTAACTDEPVLGAIRRTGGGISRSTSGHGAGSTPKLMAASPIMGPALGAGPEWLGAHGGMLGGAGSSNGRGSSAGAKMCHNCEFRCIDNMGNLRCLFAAFRNDGGNATPLLHPWPWPGRFLQGLGVVAALMVAGGWLVANRSRQAPAHDSDKLTASRLHGCIGVDSLDNAPEGVAYGSAIAAASGGVLAELSVLGVDDVARAKHRPSSVGLADNETGSTNCNNSSLDSEAPQPHKVTRGQDMSRRVESVTHAYVDSDKPLSFQSWMVDRLAAQIERFEREEAMLNAELDALRSLPSARGWGSTKWGFGRSSTAAGRDDDGQCHSSTQRISDIARQLESLAVLKAALMAELNEHDGHFNPISFHLYQQHRANRSRP